MRKLLAVLSVALAALVSAGALAFAGSGGGGDNVVLAFNSTDGFAFSRSGLAVSPTASDTVDSENLAYAKSSCVGCRTVAAAVQAVLITSNASVITPTNAAIAVNENCTSCQTFAAAYQYVITTGGPVYLSSQGQQEVSRIRLEIAEVAASGLAFPELEAELDARYEEFKAVIDRELVAAGRTPGGTTVRDVDTAAQ